MSEFTCTKRSNDKVFLLLLLLKGWWLIGAGYRVKAELTVLQYSTWFPSHHQRERSRQTVAMLRKRDKYTEMIY